MSGGSSPGPEKGSRGFDRRWALIAVAIGVVLVFALIGIYAFLPKPPGSATASGSPGTQSAYAPLFAQVGPTGEVSKETALEAFSLAIAPLPGVTVPSGAPPQDYERIDGTFAINWIWPYLKQITPEQKAAVDAALTSGSNAPLITPGSTAAAMGRLDQLFAITQDTQVDTYYSEAETAVNQIAAHLGRQLHVGWSVTVNTQQIDGANAYAYDAPVTDSFGDLSKCDIHVNPLLIKAKDAVIDTATMAHEIFHCFQFDYLEQHGGLGNMPPGWITEGQAEWAGELIGGPSSAGGDWWAEYFSTIDRNLLSRTYDAVGFYQHLAEEGLDPWKTFDAMLGSANAVDAFKVTGATADNFLDTWSSGLFRELPNGLAWFAVGPWQITASSPSQEVDLGIGDDVHVSADPLYNHDVTLKSLADLVEVRMQGHVRMHTDPDGDELDTTQRWLCTEATGCKCPPGKTYSGPEFEVVGSTVEFGMTGALAGASGVLIGHSTDEFCKAQPSQQPPCQSNCGNSNGDPHLRTINRYKYDFQAAGEFVLLRSADSSVEIQARQQPWISGSAVAINKAVAALDNGHRVSVYATDTGLALHVDGQPADPSNPPDLGAGAAVKPINKGIEIDFPDGTSLSALSVGSWGINAVINSSPAMLASGVGLLGPITPGYMGVPALPDGSQLPIAPDKPTRDKILYSTFADAWRVTDSTTLFDYGPGQSTETFTDRNFPSDAARAALDQAIASPDPARQSAAQSACAGLTDQDLIADCQYDVFATGDEGFAQSYAPVQDLYDSGIAQPTAGPTQAVPSPGGITGATKVIDLTHLQSATIGPDNTVYASIDDSSATQQPQLIAFDPTSGGVKQQTEMRVETDIHFAAGSVWASGQTTDANGQHCSVTRYDPQTLAKQGDYPIPCSAGSGAPRITSTGDAVWFISNDGTQLTQIDPASNAPGKSVPLPQGAGCCQDSQGALFCFCGNSDVWRLTASDAAFVDLGNHSPIFPAGTGFWAEQDSNAVYVNGAGAPSSSVPLNGGSIVGGDPTGVYLQGVTSSSSAQATPAPFDQLSRQPADGSAAAFLNAPPIAAAGTINETDYDYLTGGFPWFATAQGYIHLWEFKDPLTGNDALWVQWSPLP